MRSRLLLPLATAVLLAACQAESSDDEDDGRAASGEVLEGTISDAMLPLDTVRSQPPLAEPRAAASARASDEAEDAAEGEEAEATDAEAEEPAEEAPAAGTGEE